MTTTVILLLLHVAIVALLLFPLWKIFDKTGMNPMLSLLLLIPGVGPLICVLVLGLGHWPAVDGAPGEAE